MPNKFKNLLFLDIETVALTSSFSHLPERLKPLWEHKSKFLDKSELHNPAIVFEEKAAIYAEFGKVIVIGLGYIYENEQKEYCLKVKSLFGHDEKQLLQDFCDLINAKFGQQNLQLVAHNGLEFDFPYLCRRMIINKIAIPKVLQVQGKKPWEITHIDTLELWKFGDRKNYTSLELLASCLDVPTSKTDLDGSKVNYTYYIEKNLSKIANYCSRDVAVLTQIYLRLVGEEMIEEKNIFINS